MIQRILILTLILCAVSPSGGAEPSLWRDMLTQKAVGSSPGGEWSEPVVCVDVDRSVRLLNDSLVIAEPLVFFIRLRGRLPLETTYGARFAVGQDIKIFIAPHDPAAGAPYEYIPAQRPLPVPRSSFTLSEDETVELPVVCIFDPNTRSGAVFDRPGTYTVVVALQCDQAEAVGGNGLQEIGRFLVNVEMPQSGDDLTAATMLTRDGDYETFRSLQAMAFYQPSHEGIFEHLVKTAEDSVVRPYAFAALASGVYSLSIEDPSLRSRAVTLLEAFVKEYPSHLYTKDIASKIIRLQRQEGDMEGALRSFSRFYKDAHVGPRLMEGDPLVRTYIGLPREDVEGHWMIVQRPEDAVGIIRAAEQATADSLIGQLPPEITSVLGNPVGIEIGGRQ